MAVLLISFLLLMVLGCPIAFCLLCSGTLYFISNDMALIMQCLVLSWPAT